MAFSSFLKQYLVSYAKWKTEVKVTFGQIMYDEDGDKLRNNAQNWVTSTMEAQRRNWSLVDFSELDQKAPYSQAFTTQNGQGMTYQECLTYMFAQLPMYHRVGNVAYKKRFTQHQNTL